MALPRAPLPHVQNVGDVLQLIQRSKKIVVITGAGVSVSCGIPDFRSKESGLYNTLNCAEFGIPSAELLFDLDFFLIDAGPFYRFAPSLIPQDEMKPSFCHRFIRLLESKKKLLRNYTQNVDGLERKAGIKNVLECHGTMSMFYCTGVKCKKKKSLEEVAPLVEQGQVLYCDKCGEVLKPGITFFGEHVSKAFDRCIAKDVDKADMVLVLGTSLKVGGSVYDLIHHMPPEVPLILINKEQVTLPKTLSGGFDVSLLGTCDEVTSYLCERLGWGGDMNVATATPATAGENLVAHTTLATDGGGEMTTSVGNKRSRVDEAETDVKAVKTCENCEAKAAGQEEQEQEQLQQQVKRRKKGGDVIGPSTLFRCKEEGARVFSVSRG